MTSVVQITRASDQKPKPSGQTPGMVRNDGVVGKCTKLCSSAMSAKPHSGSAVHHHGEQDTIVYAVSGYGAILSGPNGSIRHDLAPGDFALIPAYTEHREINDSDVPLKWVVVRSGEEPIIVNLKDWSRTPDADRDI